ncbi:hypothetical protein HanXRQr2_Chr08g0340131 [Helianthus annuus]|uniref:Uncharacterized protein n=1 Tax=Helianthus annuus TaxID=4232 RepID=A0A9K3IFT7_HELAN|nr:hypothetical protein HanXRQr2_Chr08g0340131 [Helianthus annuus]KAJ0901713.1 hypothetical protein HanPSC8_Chr08g0328521 [Helianthus annuus]
MLLFGNVLFLSRQSACFDGPLASVMLMMIHIWRFFRNSLNTCIGRRICYVCDMLCMIDVYALA